MMLGVASNKVQKLRPLLSKRWDKETQAYLFSKYVVANVLASSVAAVGSVIDWQMNLFLFNAFLIFWQCAVLKVAQGKD